MNLQRPLVWTLNQKRSLIESVLIRRSIPLISVVQTLDDTYQVIDGRQRLSAFIEYVQGVFDFCGYYCNDLPKDYLGQIQRHYICCYRLCEYDTPITDDEKVEWFNWINFAGTPQDVEHMERLRNANFNTNKKLARKFYFGLKEEGIAITKLESLGHKIKKSSHHEDRLLDIDVYLDGKSLSIKCQHRLFNSGLIRFELCHQLQDFRNCDISRKLLDGRPLVQKHVNRLMQLPSWEKGSWNRSKSELILFYQESQMRIYSTQELKEYISVNQWNQLQVSSDYETNIFGYEHRYFRAILGFLPWNCVPHELINLPLRTN